MIWTKIAFGIWCITAVALVGIVLADFDDSSEDGGVSAGVDNGLGEHIDWSTLDDGLSRAKQENKPLMLIIHKSWCGACKCRF